MPIGKARAIARALISWVNSNSIFSFPDGSSHQTRRCAPLPSPHTPPSPPRPSPPPSLRHHHRHHRHRCLRASVVTVTLFVTATSPPPTPPSSPPPPPSPPGPYASAWQGAIAASAIAASAFPNPPTRRSPPSTRRRPHHWHCHCLLRPQPHHRHPRTTTLAAITISSRPVMRNGRDARACPRHMRAPTRSPALCTHSTPRTSWPSPSTTLTLFRLAFWQISM